MKTFLDDLEWISERHGDQHRTLIAAFLNESKSAMAGHLAFSRVGADRLKATLSDIALTYLEMNEEKIEEILPEISKDAHRAALEHLRMSDAEIDADQLSELLGDVESASSSFISGEIVSQVNRDVNQVIRDYRNASIRASMLAENVGQQAANIQVMIDEMNSGRKLWFKDRAGRKIPSQKYVRRLWRQVLRDHWVQVYIKTLAMFGETKAVVWHEDHKHRAFGIELDILEPDYGLHDIDKVFHPNSRALPVAQSYMMEMV